MNTLKKLWAKTPAAVKTEGMHVVLVFAVTFVATAAVAFPALYAQFQLGKFPSFSTAHALIAASLSAALKATIPVARAVVVGIVGKWLSKRKDRKELLAAVQEYLAAKQLAQVVAAQPIEVAPAVEPAPAVIEPAPVA